MRRARAFLQWAVIALAAALTSLTCRLAAADVQDAGRLPQEQGPSPSGPRLALRTGFAVPIGPAYTASGALLDTISGYVPLRLDAGYRIARHFYVGADVQLATILPNACPAGASCSGSDLRFGVMAAYHLLPGSLVDPWIGLGTGFERLSVSRTVDGITGTLSARGMELLDLDLGVDVRPSRALRIGPVLSGSFCRYTRVAINDVGTSDFDPALHVWVFLGMRGAYDL